MTSESIAASATQELQHAWDHLDLLMPAGQLEPAMRLEFASAGVIYDHTEM